MAPGQAHPAHLLHLIPAPPGAPAAAAAAPVAAAAVANPIAGGIFAAAAAAAAGQPAPAPPLAAFAPLAGVPHVPGYPNPRPDLRACMTFVRPFDGRETFSFRGTLQKLFHFAVAQDFTHEHMKTVLFSLLPAEHLEAYTAMQQDPLQSITDYFLALEPQSLSPQAAEAQLASFKRTRKETPLACMNRYDLLHRRASILFAGRAMLHDQERIRVLLTIVGPLTAAALKLQQQQQTSLNQHIMSFQDLLTYAIHMEQVLGEFDIVNGFNGGTPDPIPLSNLSLDANLGDFRHMLPNAKVGNNPYMGTPWLFQRREERAADANRRRSGSRDKQHASNRELYTPMDVDQSGQTAPTYTPGPAATNFSAAPAPMKPFVAPQTMPSGNVYPSSPYRPDPPAWDRPPRPRSASTGGQRPQSAPREPPREPRRDAPREPPQEARREPPREPYQDRGRSQTRRPDQQPGYGGGQGGQGRPDSRGRRTDRNVAPRYDYQGRPTTPSFRRDPSPWSAAPYYDPRPATPTGGRPPSANRNTPRSASSGREMSNTCTLSGQRYPRYRRHGEHVEEDFNFQDPPKYCRQCGGKRDQSTGRLRMETGHNSYNCPRYFAYNADGCSVCAKMSKTAHHYERDCLHYKPPN